MVLYRIEKYMPDPRLVPFLKELTKYYSGELNFRICRTLGAIGSPDAISFLIEQLPETPGQRRDPRHWDRNVESEAYQALVGLCGVKLEAGRGQWQRWWQQHAAEFAAAKQNGVEAKGPTP